MFRHTKCWKWTTQMYTLNTANDIIKNRDEYENAYQKYDALY